MLAAQIMIAVMPLAAMGTFGQDTPKTRSTVEQVTPAASNATAVQASPKSSATAQIQKKQSPHAGTMEGSRLPEDLRVKAAQEVAEGNFEGALKIYDAASRTATSSGDMQMASEAKISYGRAVEQWVNIDPKQASRLAEAQTAYQQAAASGTGPQKAVALNNSASLYLRQNHAADAVATFRQIDFAALPREQAHIVHYNYARALETDHNAQAAYAEYRAALAARPGYVPAADGALRSLRLMPAIAPRVKESLDLGRELLSQGFTDQALAATLLGLQQWTQGPGRDDLLLLLARSLAAAGVDAKTFDERYGSKFRDEALNQRFGKELAEIRVAYSKMLWPSIGSAPYKILPTWNRSALQPGMSTLLSAVGQAYGRAGNKDEAIARYELAWRMDSGNAEAALYAADILREDNARYARVLEPLIEPLFQSKAMAYQSNDLLNIFRLHMVLGTYFEAQKVWGEPNSFNPRSAIFQFEHAASTARTLQASDKNFPPVPGLHYRLASAYEQSAAAASSASRRDDLEKKAWTEYLAAAQEFVKSSNAAAATGALKQARKLPIQHTQEMEGTFVGIERDISKLQGA
jgi:hypothetical protein